MKVVYDLNSWAGLHYKEVSKIKIQTTMARTRRGLSLTGCRVGEAVRSHYCCLNFFRSVEKLISFTKIISLLLLLLLLAPVAIAEVECNKVLVIKFNYNNGIITYKDKIIKCGYAPDRKIQPIEGYKAEIISKDNKPLYSFKFEIPLKLNFDLSDPIIKSLSGGLLILNETDFALIFPYYDEAKSIIIYNPRKYEILSIPLIEEQFIQQKSFWWSWILVLALLILICIIYRKIYNKKSRKNVNQ